MLTGIENPDSELGCYAMQPHDYETLRVSLTGSFWITTTVHPSPGLMDQQERINFEKTLMPAFGKLKEKMGGTVYSLSPDFGTKEGPVVKEVNPNLIDEAKYNELVKAHVFFKNIVSDPFVKCAGISSDWPYGRG